MTTMYDAIIIGTGQAGPFLARRLTTAGMKVAIIERKLFGGTCVNTGCIPTKTMVASAYAAHLARRAADFGVDTAGVSIDMKRVKARKDEVSGQSKTGLEAWLKKMENCTVYAGHARFESPREVAVGSEKLTAERIFINVSGRAATPQMPGLEQIEYLTNSSMMYAKAPYTVIQRAMHIHPTVSELIPTMLGRAPTSLRDSRREAYSLASEKSNYAGLNVVTQSGQPRIAVWIEDPSQVMILIGWDSVEAPTQHRGTPTHNATREGTAVIEPKKHRRALPLSGLQPQPRGGIVCD